MWGAHWTIHLEKRGIPSVFIVDEPFIDDVQVTCDKEGMPRLGRVIVPHPCGDVPDDQLPRFISRMIEVLTVPVNHVEQREVKPTGIDTDVSSRIAVSGTLEEIQDYFDEHAWTDGLPIVPPTEDRVSAMLQGTSHAPDKIVTNAMLPESWTVTVEKVAIVGVMAGCKPGYMPVLLAIVEAFANGSFSSSVRSTTSFSFVVMVNGPIAKQIGMNAGINALGSGTGNKANATIGRFLRLALINLGGSQSGVSDMSSQGNPSKFSFAFAENEARSPWEPYHVSQGYQSNESVVTIMSGGWSHMGTFGNVDLDQIARTITTMEFPNGALIIMDPMAARSLAKRGYTKQEVEEYIWAHATRTMGEFRADHFYPLFIEPLLRGKAMHGQKYLWPARYLELPDDAIVQVFPRGKIKVVVVGGETNPFSQAWRMAYPITVSVDRWR
jgi:hypothetical protein